MLVKSSPRIDDACCAKPDCVFRVHAYKGKWKDYFEVNIVVDHTYALDH
jgi:hypothetical protein